MPKYIRTDNLIEEGWVLERHGVSNKLVGTMSLADVPIVDVVEIVRCKDCKHRNTSNCSMYWESDDHTEQYSWENDDDFCSWGKKKDIEDKK